jgi:hypothetical protein
MPRRAAAQARRCGAVNDNESGSNRFLLSPNRFVYAMGFGWEDGNLSLHITVSYHQFLFIILERCDKKKKQTLKEM